MRDRLSAQALDALHLAEKEARAMAHEYVGTEHLLLGLLAQQDTPAATALQRLGVRPALVRAETERIVGPGEGSGSGSIPLTPLATRALERTATEAEARDEKQATGEDLLVALAQVRDGLAARIMGRMDVSLEQVRAALAGLHGSGSEASG
jgi:ATP-dependent Clp protease ATP-binding subunit ClpC